jgi:hypothetical protein
LKKGIAQLLLILTLFLILSTLVSCSAQKRFKRLVKKHPELVKNLDTKVRFKDTVYFNQTIIAPGYTDSVYITKDTTIYKDRLNVSKTGNWFKFTDYPDTINNHDTAYIDKLILVPGQIIDNTPGWIQWCLNNKLNLLAVLANSILFILIYKNKSGG